MIFGYARSEMTNKAFQEKIKPHLEGDAKTVSAFLEHCEYVSGDYDPSKDGYKKLESVIERFEEDITSCDCIDVKSPCV